MPKRDDRDDGDDLSRILYTLAFLGKEGKKRERREVAGKIVPIVLTVPLTPYGACCGPVKAAFGGNAGRNRGAAGCGAVCRACLKQLRGNTN